MKWEISYLERIKDAYDLIPDKNKSRDWLISLYDRIGEVGY
jgi:hypothetical protein